MSDQWQHLEYSPGADDTREGNRRTGSRRAVEPIVKGELGFPYFDADRLHPDYCGDRPIPRMGIFESREHFVGHLGGIHWPTVAKELGLAPDSDEATIRAEIARREAANMVRWAEVCAARGFDPTGAVVNAELAASAYAVEKAAQDVLNAVRRAEEAERQRIFNAERSAKIIAAATHVATIARPTTRDAYITGAPLKDGERKESLPCFCSLAAGKYYLQVGQWGGRRRSFKVIGEVIEGGFVVPHRGW